MDSREAIVNHVSKILHLNDGCCWNINNLAEVWFKNGCYFLFELREEGEASFSGLYAKDNNKTTIVELVETALKWT
jgi:hypothetical protein